jgi:hypothetical protein
MQNLRYAGTTHNFPGATVYRSRELDTEEVLMLNRIRSPKEFVNQKCLKKWTRSAGSSGSPGLAHPIDLPCYRHRSVPYHPLD